jgi:hypothetical protein
MQSGFEAAGFPSGVPMIPRPQSGAWLLCGLLKSWDAGRDCNWLEDEPGNDASPNNLKARLAREIERLGCAPTCEQFAEMVITSQMDAERNSLPSFIDFRDQLDRAYDQATMPLN